MHDEHTRIENGNWRMANAKRLEARQPSAAFRSTPRRFAPIRAGKIPARLASPPISSWRHTNETANVRHVGADGAGFRAALGLGRSDKRIEYVDEEGVVLAAIPGLDEKLPGGNGEHGNEAPA